jgi:hypothetical protein
MILKLLQNKPAVDAADMIKPKAAQGEDVAMNANGGSN